MGRATSLAWAILWIGCFFVPERGHASDDDVYKNQVEMTAALFAAKPETFGDVCRGLKGQLKQNDQMSTCQRGLSILAIAYEGDWVKWAMIAYPVSEKDIRGLRDEARARFGEPDSAKNRELTWRLPRGVIASAGYDDEFSTFTLAREVPQ
ncbi:MAG: hypothetical protein AAF997_24740 [Myxococcota bacterium]